MNYYVLLVGKLILVLVIGILGLKALTLLLKCRKKYMTADIAAALNPLWVGGKGLMIFAALLFLFFAGIVMSEDDRQSARLHIALTYPEASQGMNPNGSRYNMSNILSDDVLEAAIAFGGFENVTVDTLRSSLEILPVETVKQDEEDGSGEDGMVSTQFELSFRNNRKTKNLTGREVVSAVGYAYRNWFIEEYAVNDDILDISFDDIQEYDYPDLNAYFSNAVQVICSLSSSYYERDATFRSSVTGESFYSINSKAWDINNTGLENLNAYVLANGLSENRSDFLSRLRYEYTNLCNDYRSTILSYDVRIEAIRKYDNDMATVVYIPTYDTDNTFYMSKTKIGIDHFSEDADLLSDSASTTLSMILDQQYLLRRLEETGGDSAAALKAEEMIAQLKTEILTLSDVLKKTISDYAKTSSNGYISLTEPGSSWTSIYALSVGFGAVFLFLLYLNRALKQLLSGRVVERKVRESR